MSGEQPNNHPTTPPWTPPALPSTLPGGLGAMPAPTGAGTRRVGHGDTSPTRGTALSPCVARGGSEIPEVPLIPNHPLISKAGPSGSLWPSSCFPHPPCPPGWFPGLDGAIRAFWAAQKDQAPSPHTPLAPNPTVTSPSTQLLVEGPHHGQQHPKGQQQSPPRTTPTHGATRCVTQARRAAALVAWRGISARLPGHCPHLGTTQKKGN